MKILIPGGAGYIGSSLVPRLLERNHEVDVVDLLWFDSHLPSEVKVEQKDGFKLSEEDLQGVDQVICLAGLSNDPMAEFSPSRNFISNAALPAYLGYIAKRAGVQRFIFAGSCSVYGSRANELCAEEDPVVSTYPYGISKLQGEYALLHLVDRSFSVISLRQGTVCGYSPRMRLDLVANTMFRAAVESKQINVNNPEIWRPILSVQDAVSAYIRAVEANQEISGIFNIASGNYTVGEIGGIVRNVLEAALETKIKLNIHHRQDYRNYKVDIGKAAKVLSFNPKHDVEFIVRHLLENMDRFKDFENPMYYNIEVFKNIVTAPAGAHMTTE